MRNRLLKQFCGLFCISLCVSISLCAEEINTYLGLTCDDWWENTLDKSVPLEQFAEWVGDEKAPSRVAVRNHIKRKKYASILDVPCGLCIDYFGFKIDKINIKYHGLDVTPYLIEKAQEKKIPVTQGSIENIPFLDSSFDICYARHILEHLPYYEKALKELIRVSTKEVLVVFFIKPTAKKDMINLEICKEYPLYHNRYARGKLETFLLSNPKVLTIQWEKVNEQEEILHIYTQVS